jgi:hypothetical protein
MDDKDNYPLSELDITLIVHCEAGIKDIDDRIQSLKDAGVEEPQNHTISARLIDYRTILECTISSVFYRKLYANEKHLRISERKNGNEIALLGFILGVIATFSIKTLLLVFGII